MQYKITIVGAGYVGMSLSVLLAQNHNVILFDINQEKVMRIYKNRFSSSIYEIDYDLLVTNPETTIKSLIKWLGWEWNNNFLSPHKNQRTVLTASNVQVRSPINPKSIGGWKNYKNMLKPAISILSATDQFQDVI